MNAPVADPESRESWQTYVSWNQFAWLYLVSLFTALRGLLLRQASMPGGEVWMAGAAVVLVVALVLRYWVRYVATSQRVLIKNGFTGRDLQAIAWEHVSEMSIKQGLIGWVLGIGTIVFRSTHSEDPLQFRGVHDPEATLRQIQTVRRRRIFPLS